MTVSLDPLRRARAGWDPSRPKAPRVPPVKVWSVWVKFSDSSRLMKRVRGRTSQEALARLFQATLPGIRGSYGNAEVIYLTVREVETEAAI